MITETENKTQRINPPEPLNSTHNITCFECRTEGLNKWLKESAQKFAGNTARTYVVTVENRVIAYYCLATSIVDRNKTTSTVNKTSPTPIPCMLIGRLATDSNWEKQGIGSGLLKDAILRILQVAKIAGVKAILVHAGDQKAKDFYTKRGFKKTSLDPMTLIIALKNIKELLL